MIKKLKSWLKTTDGKANASTLFYVFVAYAVLIVFNLFTPIKNIHEIFICVLLFEILCTVFKIEMKINELKENTGKGVVEKWLN